MSLETVRQHIHEQFERAHKLYECPGVAPTSLKPDVTLADKAEPILHSVVTLRGEHRRRDCVSHEIVEPKVDDLKALFDEALISLGFKKQI